MIWANFLHFYQPPTQKKYWIDRVTDESYRRLVNGLLAEPRAKITLNINSILCELWEEYHHDDVLEGVKKLVQSGQIELTGSAKFHPLLPKLPKDQVVRQIRLNEESLGRYFEVVSPNDVQRSTSNGRRIKGFFPPEMAYDRNLAAIVAELGYEWILAEELSLGKTVDYSKVYSVSGISKRGGPKGEAFKIFFRDRAFSYKLLAGYLGTEKLFLDELAKRFPVHQDQQYLLTAMDGETFGHHRPGMEQLLFELFKIPQVEMVHISQLPSLFKTVEKVTTKPSTWALMEHEVEKNLPFARWDDPENQVHRLQWQLTDLAINAICHPEGLTTPKDLNGKDSSDRTPQNDNFKKAQELLDRALHSDQYWWASAKPWWSIEYIERGAKELLEAVRATGQAEGLPTEASAKAGQKAQELYYKILETAFEYQRSGIVDEISKKEDETMRMRTDQTLPQMPKEELIKIIETIRKEMMAVVAKQEYERATQLRDRIKELETYLKI